jgi:hypothetical protein
MIQKISCGYFRDVLAEFALFWTRSTLGKKGVFIGYCTEDYSQLGSNLGTTNPAVDVFRIRKMEKQHHQY